MMKYKFLVPFLMFAALSAQAASSPISGPGTPLPLTVSLPAGGEVYVIGTDQALVAGKNHCKTITFELSRDGGHTYETLGVVNNSKLKPAFRNVFKWRVAGPVASNCVIRMSGMAGKKPYQGVSSIFAIGTTDAVETGVVGPQGPAGPVGADGVAGPQGPAGPAGAAGANANPQDVIGLLINNNDFLSTLIANLLSCDNFITQVEQKLVTDNNFYNTLVSNLITNKTFITATTGPAGAQGPKGATGATGAAGQQGVQGPVGATGSQGPQGPAGPTGAQGPAGPKGCNFRGVWVSTVNYIIGDVITFNGSVYISIVNSTNCTPTNTTYWTVFCTGGATGPAGAQGPAGATGAAGAKGDTGSQGPAGAQGPAGPAGASGYAAAVFCHNLTSTSQEHDEVITDSHVKANSVIVCQFVDTGNNNNNVHVTIRSESNGSFKVHLLGSCSNFQLTDGINYIVVNP